MTGPAAGGHEKRSDHSGFDALLERSSLGTAGAQRLRGRISLTEGRFIGRLGRTWEIRIGIARAAAPPTWPSEPDDADADYGHSRPGELPAAGFWDSLSPDQRRAFSANAHKRVFAAGARLMLEGEQSDHVAVILSGLTEIRVREDGAERVVAERGPGQLIGERAVLEVNRRSVTVVARETVVALVIRTGDFAAFIGTYPGVLKIVEAQIYSRLREGPAGDTASGWAAPEQPGRRSARITPQPPLLTGQNCTVVRTDLVAFGADERDEQARRIIRQASSDMTRQALGPVWDACRWEDRGDGLLIAVSPDVPTADVIDRLATMLPRELKRHNRLHSDAARIQLRAAVDVGPVLEDGDGMTGHSSHQGQPSAGRPRLQAGHHRPAGAPRPHRVLVHLQQLSPTRRRLPRPGGLRPGPGTGQGDPDIGVDAPGRHRSRGR